MTLPHMDKKDTSEKVDICSNTLFSFYFKSRAKKFFATKLFAFSLHFLFQRDQNHYSKLTSKIKKICDPILGKDSAPIKLKIFEIKKN